MVSAKDIVLNLLKTFGADSLLGHSVELYGDEVDRLTLDERITIASMATELGAIILLFPPAEAVIDYCRSCSHKKFMPVYADPEAGYKQRYELDLSKFKPAVSLPGQPHNVAFIEKHTGTKIDSVFVGSCTNGRMEDMREAAMILDGRKVAPGVVMKIVPSTDKVWNECLKEGIIGIFKKAGALVGNPGCAGCASGQIGQNGPGEKTVSTGNRNFRGKQGKGEVYLTSVSVAAATAIAGHITTADRIPEEPSVFRAPERENKGRHMPAGPEKEKSMIIEGKVWIIPIDNIDTDMIFHNQHLAVTDIREMGKYTFGNLNGWEDYPQKSEPGDIILTGKNFGAGSSRQQAVDCFRSLQNQAILAESFGAIYERNAINAGFPVLTYNDLGNLELKNRDTVVIDMEIGTITNIMNKRNAAISRFSEVQKMIYRKGDLLLI
jgi:aconitase A